MDGQFPLLASWFQVLGPFCYSSLPFRHPISSLVGKVTLQPLKQVESRSSQTLVFLRIARGIVIHILNNCSGWFWCRWSEKHTFRNTSLKYFRCSILSSRGGCQEKNVRLFSSSISLPKLWFPRTLGNNNTMVHVHYTFTVPRASLSALHTLCSLLLLRALRCRSCYCLCCTRKLRLRQVCLAYLWSGEVDNRIK